MVRRWRRLLAAHGFRIKTWSEGSELLCIADVSSVPVARQPSWGCVSLFSASRKSCHFGLGKHCPRLYDFQPLYRQCCGSTFFFLYLRPPTCHIIAGVEQATCLWEQSWEQAKWHFGAGLEPPERPFGRGLEQACSVSPCLFIYYIRHCTAE